MLTGHSQAQSYERGAVSNPDDSGSSSQGNKPRVIFVIFVHEFLGGVMACAGKASKMFNASIRQEPHQHHSTPSPRNFARQEPCRPGWQAMPDRFLSLRKWRIQDWTSTAKPTVQTPHAANQERRRKRQKTQFHICMVRGASSSQECLHCSLLGGIQRDSHSWRNGIRFQYSIYKLEPCHKFIT